MSFENRHEELSKAFKAEMEEYIAEGFRSRDCFPVVFANLIESTGLPATDRAELRRELMEWTLKTI